MFSNTKKIKKCLVCNSKYLETYLDFGKMPLANDNRSDNKCKLYPLSVNVCTECTHSQLKYVVNPKILFSNYQYVSGTTKTLHDFFERIKEKALLDLANNHGQMRKIIKVLDIGANDGTFLSKFKSTSDIDFFRVGIDPASNLAKDLKNNCEVAFNKFFSDKLAKKIKKEYGTFDIILAFNVLAHNNDPQDFIAGVSRLLYRHGIAYIQTSQSDFIENGQIDSVYHEHMSYFSATSFDRLIEKSWTGYIPSIRLDVQEIHGKSNLFCLNTKTTNKLYDATIKDKLLFNNKKNTYNKLMGKFDYDLLQIASIIESYKSMGFNIIGYGAAAKANTTVNRLKQIQFLTYTKHMCNSVILEENALKAGKLFAGTDIPIISIQDFKPSGKYLVWILAWNFKDEIIKKLETIMGECEWEALILFPQLEIIKKDKHD